MATSAVVLMPHHPVFFAEPTDVPTVGDGWCPQARSEPFRALLLDVSVTFVDLYTQAPLTNLYHDLTKRNESAKKEAGMQEKAQPALSSVNRRRLELKCVSVKINIIGYLIGYLIWLRRSQKSPPSPHKSHQARSNIANPNLDTVHPVAPSPCSFHPATEGQILPGHHDHS